MHVDKGRPVTTLPTVLFNEFYVYKQTLRKSTYRQKSSTALSELRTILIDQKRKSSMAQNHCPDFENFPVYPVWYQLCILV